MTPDRGMEVTFHNVARHFGKEIVLSGMDLALEAGSRTALLGPNGSGKSTFLLLVAGALEPTSGTVAYRLKGAALPQEDLYRHIAIAAPYLGLYEDLTLREALLTHARFKTFLPGLDPLGVARQAYLDEALDKPLRNFSSGMKQRLKLALAILSDTPLLLLDEPTSNLDAAATAWYRELVEEHARGRTLLVCSNHQPREYDLCTKVLDIEAYKRPVGTFSSGTQ